MSSKLLFKVLVISVKKSLQSILYWSVLHWYISFRLPYGPVSCIFTCLSSNARNSNSNMAILAKFCQGFWRRLDYVILESSAKFAKSKQSFYVNCFSFDKWRTQNDLWSRRECRMRKTVVKSAKSIKYEFPSIYRRFETSHHRNKAIFTSLALLHPETFWYRFLSMRVFDINIQK